jgi:outer membrane protein
MRHPVRTAALALALLLAPAARAEVKLGFLDFQRAGNEIEEGKAATATLKREVDEAGKRVDALRDSFQKQVADFDKMNATGLLNAENRQAKGLELQKKQAENQAIVDKIQHDLAERDAELTRGIQDRLRLVAKDIAESEGLTAILTANAAVYAQSSLDVTNEAIRRYNARFPIGAKKADAPAKKADAPAAAASAPAKK